MLFLLRKIRRKLMEKNKFTTYLLYAIGEIVLVVIGILIAVSINNWNQQLKNDKRISQALTFLTNELKEDSVQISIQLTRHIGRRNESKQLFDRAKSPDATIDTLIYIMTNEFDGYWDKHFAYNTTAYENMITGGILELLDDSLKIHITETYQTYERNMVAMNEQNLQYREPMNDFYSRFPILSFYRHEDFIKDWRPQDKEEFHPRAEWLIFVRYFMWNSYINCLEEERLKVNALLSNLRTYCNSN